MTLLKVKLKISTFVMSKSKRPKQTMRGAMRVFVSGDGGVDDLAALTMTVAAMMAGSIEIVGVAVTGGNCFLDAGVQASRKILDLAGFDGKVQVSTCDAEGVNPFPRSWRSASYGICHIPRLLRDGRPRTEVCCCRVPCEVAHYASYYKLQPTSTWLNAA